MSNNNISSTIASFSCINEKALNFFWFIVKPSHVLSYLIIENNLSRVADVAPFAFVKPIRMVTTTFLINSHFFMGKILNDFDDISKVD